jgi:polynucleotide 5'-kinase involved in rRNA processing
MKRIKTYQDLFEAFDYSQSGFRGYNQIILVAPKNSGKTSIGKWLADKLKYQG